MSLSYTSHIFRTALFALFIFTLAVFYPGSAYAYLGPGLGLGALGIAAGILLSVVLAIVAVVWYPLKRLFKNRKEDKKQPETTATVVQSEHEEPENKT